MIRFARNVLLTGAPFTIGMGLLFAPCGFVIGWGKILTLALAMGVAFGLAMACFAASPLAHPGRPTLLDGERLLYEGAANHLVPGEGVGGRLFLTNRRLIFISHSFNVQNHAGWCALADIQKVERFRVIGILPTGLRLSLASGDEARFIIELGSQWIPRIEAARVALPELAPVPVLRDPPANLP